MTQPLHQETIAELKECLDDINFDHNVLHELWTLWMGKLDKDSELTEWKEYMDVCVSISRVLVAIASSNCDIKQDDIEANVLEFNNAIFFSKITEIAQSQVTSSLTENEQFYMSIIGVFIFSLAYILMSVVTGILWASFLTS